MTCETLTFKDDKGREYEALVTATRAIKMQKRGANIKDLVTGDLLERLSTDAELLVDVLWLAVEPSATAQGVTPEDFGESLSGDTLAVATDVLLDAMADFLAPPVSSAFKAALQKARELKSLASEEAQQILGSMTAADILATAKKQAATA